jgi:hypothetical protein
VQLLHPFFERLGHQVLHLLGRGSWPDRRDRETLDREGRVLRTAEPQECADAGEDDRDDKKQRYRPLPNGEGGENERKRMTIFGREHWPIALVVDGAKWDRYRRSVRGSPVPSSRSPAATFPAD